mgnify:CR=1 FL=1
MMGDRKIYGRLCKFTPLERPVARDRVLSTCSKDEDKIPFRTNTGFKIPCEPYRWKVEELLMGLTLGWFVRPWRCGVVLLLGFHAVGVFQP